MEGYVLSNFWREESWVEALIGVVADKAPILAAGEDAEFEHQVHRAMSERGFSSRPKRSTK